VKDTLDTRERLRTLAKNLAAVPTLCRAWQIIFGLDRSAYREEPGPSARCPQCGQVVT
jgi:hypothetical protein